MTELIVSQSQTEASPFDSIRRFDSKGNEYWYARELMPLLEYHRWDRVPEVIVRAQHSCRNAGNSIAAHFSEETRKTNGRPMQDFKLSRYAAYLVAMNGDPRKESVGQAQSYFATKAREAEINDSVDEVAKDIALYSEIGKLLEWAGIDPLLIAGHVMTQCASRHPALADRFEGMKRLIPQQASMQLESPLLNPTEIGKKFDPPLSPRSVNKYLLDLGLQAKSGQKSPPYVLTEKGQEHGKVTLNQGSHSAKTVQQVKWKDSVVDLIDRHLELVEA